MLPKTQILTAILMAVAATGSAQAQISSPRMARNP